MATIAVLGMGLLGRGFAENALSKGHEVRVWNRTASKCAPVVAQGAIQAETPADAVRGADRVHLVLTADDAVEQVIGAFGDALSAGTPVLDHSTNLPDRVRARYAALRAKGVKYLHAPVFMGPANSREGTGLMLACGPAAEIAALKPALLTMTGHVLELGEEPGKAAAIKLTGNGMLVLLTAGMGDLFKLGRANGLTPDDTLALFDLFAPTPAGMGRRILASATAPVGFELTMARKDVGLMIEASGGPEALDVLPAIAASIDAAIAAGRGSEDFTAFVRPD
ncbi:MAG: NAD(P)-dependent oxidoreductase [Myxococcota bacterium]